MAIKRRVLDESCLMGSLSTLNTSAIMKKQISAGELGFEILRLMHKPDFKALIFTRLLSKPLKELS